MSNDGGLADLSLMDLFRSEVEMHSEVLSAALLVLERSPGDTSRVDEMMRAAHSIKGAARVVDVEPAVSVAHVMEDCFVAAQQGSLTLSDTDVDVLLRGVDLLVKISEATRDPKADLANDFDDAVKSLVFEIEAMLVPGEKLGGSPREVAACDVGSRQAADAAISDSLVSPSGAPTTVPGATTIVFPEMLDSVAAEDVRKRFLAALECGSDSVQFDLCETKDLDVQGLVLLAAIPRHVAKHGRPQVRLTGVSAEMETVLNVTGLRASYTGCAPATKDESR
jgi:two-component system sensor histidine kinase and response regulator WspE